MDEIAKSNEEEEPEVTPLPAGSDSSPIEEAKKVLEESRKVLEETKAERKRIEKATAEMLVNGKSYAGQTAPKPIEETPQEYAKRVMSGKV